MAASTLCSSVPILAYHFFRNGRHSYDLSEGEEPYCLDQSLLREHLQGLRDAGYELLSLPQYLAGESLPPRPVLLTVDDGHLSFLEVALPVLAEFSAPVTLFLVGGNLRRPDYLPTSQIAELTAQGVEIGSHGQSHRPLTSMPLEQARAEMAQSRQMLQEAAGGEVSYLALPHGFGSKAIFTAARELGYQAVCTSQFGLNPRAPVPFCLKRVGIKGPMTWRDLQPLLCPDTVPFRRACLRDRAKTVAKWALRMHRRG